MSDLQRAARHIGSSVDVNRHMVGYKALEYVGIDGVMLTIKNKKTKITSGNKIYRLE